MINKLHQDNFGYLNVSSQQKKCYTKDMDLSQDSFGEVLQIRIYVIDEQKSFQL